MEASHQRWVVLLLAGLAATAGANEVANGDFEAVGPDGNRPAQWQTSGAATVQQQLDRDRGRRDEGFAARLVCAEFAGNSAAAHAMVCQVGIIGLRRGTWYRLQFWARSEGIASEAVEVAISNTTNWSNSGLAEAIDSGPEWRHHELYFQSLQDLAPADSRLQFWFRSRGTLWLDDVELTATEMKAQWHPQLPGEGRVNLVPNSSFECRAAGWGSYAPDLNTWMGNAYSLLGSLDDNTAAHGRSSLRLHLASRDAPTFHFDWFDPIRQPVRVLVAAHEGWAPLPKGKPCTLSAALKADAAGTMGLLLVRQAGARVQRLACALTDTWQRYTFTFTAESDWAWAGVGLDLAASQREAATVWVDAVQLEAGAAATPYQPAVPVELRATTGQPGNTFVRATERPALRLDLHAFNATPTPRQLTATIAVTDFRDDEVLRQEVTVEVPGQSTASPTVVLPTGAEGFFRVQVSNAEGPLQPALRCAILGAPTAGPARFGMNHAYPWDFMLPLAHQAGLTWWRDWSVQWRTVQASAAQGFDFREPDVQIERALRPGGNVLVLFPFPSSDWASTADAAGVEKAAKNEYERRRVPLAFKPRDEAAFSRYIAASVAHYRGRVTAYQVFNEALYTNYSLPAASGHTVADYIRLLRLAAAAIKAEQPGAVVVGGLGIWADSAWTRDFVEAGGMQYLDVLDLHLYPRGRPEPYAESLGELRRRLAERGEVKPIWITELGCYADDDPAKTPMAAAFGDAAMRRALRADERDATVWLVQFATLVAAQGVERIFLHAGICGEINGVDTGGILFEYGGTPRKMLAGLAALSRWLPADAVFERSENLTGKITAHWFRRPAGRVAIAWSVDGQQHSLPLPPGVQAADLMGNALPAEGLRCGREPVYLSGP